MVVNLASLRPAGFPTIRFAGGSNYATLAIAGTTALPGTIAGFIGPHDTIDLTTIGDAANDVVTSFDTVTNRLTISGAQGSVQLHLDAENYAGLAFLATSDGAGGTFVYPTSAVPPSINHTIALQAVADQAPSRPFTGVTITDPSIGQDETLTVALSPAGGGTLSNLGGGSFNPATGTYTITDSPGSVSAALAGLVFTPAAPAGGLLATTAFTLTVTGPGGSATDTASSVTTVTQLPPYLGLAANQYRFAVSASGGPPVFSGGGGITESLVSNPLQGGVYAVPAGAAAAYLGGTADATLYNPTPSGALLVGNAGNDQILAGIGPDTVVTGTGANRVLLGSGNAVVISAGQDQIAGGSGNASITSGSNNPLIFLGPGANTVTAGVGGNPTVVAGRGADTIAANGGSQLWLGAGTALVTSTGADTVIAGPGAATIAASGDALVFGADGPLHFTGGSGAPTVIGGSGGATIQGGSGPMLALAYGPAAFTAAGGATTVAGFGASGITITGGSGPGLFVGAPGGHNAITTGTGPATILGGGDGDLLTATSTAIIVAGPGAETINAGTSSAPTNIFGGSGAAVIRLGSGLSEVLAGPGSATVIAGTGTDILAFAQGTAGTTIVQGFNPLHDAIGLLGYAPGEPAAALAGARTAGGSETLTLSDGTHITLLGFTGLTVGSFL